MRLMVFGIGIAALLWSGYWLIGSRQASADMRVWFETRAADGWSTNFAELSTRGYPNRFDTTITAPELALPGGAFRWSAPFVQVLRLSYKPEHAIVIFPTKMAVSLAEQQIAVTSNRLRASTVFERGDTPVLDRANLEGEDLAFKLATFGNVSVGRTLAAIRKAAALPAAHDLAIDLRKVVLSDGSAATSLPLEFVSLDATVTLDGPLSVAGYVAGQIDIIDIDLRRFQISSDAFDVSATGRLTLDSDGLPSGTLDVKVRDWANLVRHLAGAGLLSQTTRASIEAELTRETEHQGGANLLDVQLDIRRGAVFFGATRLR